MNFSFKGYFFKINVINPIKQKTIVENQNNPVIIFGYNSDNKIPNP